MKKIITSLIFAVALSAMAEEHMTFMGIPIDGQLGMFCQALEKENFRLDTISSHSARYVGLVMTRPAYVVMETTPKTHTVYDVLVAYPNIKKWTWMEALYTDIKARLTCRYGEPVEVKEIGEAPAYDILIQDKLEDASLIRRTRFETEVGYIDLGIDNLRLFSGSSGSPYTYVIYIDKANETKNEQEAFCE